MLDRELPAARVGRAQREQRQTADVVERRALVDRLVQPGDQRDADAELLALPDPVDEDVIGLGREREDHVPRGGSLDRLGKVVGPAEHRQRVAIGRAEAGQRIVVEEPDRAQAVGGLA